MGLEDFSPVASVLSSVIGGISSASTSNRALRQQYRMFREANEFNAKQAQLNRDFQTNERLATQSFNSPLSQRAQLAAAGLPVTDTSGGSSVAAQPSSASSGDVASSAAPPTVTPAQPFDFSSVVSDALQAASVAANIRRLDSQTSLERRNQMHREQVDNSQLALARNEDSRASEMHDKSLTLADKQIELATEQVTKAQWENFIAPESWNDQHALSGAQVQAVKDAFVLGMTQVESQLRGVMAQVSAMNNATEVTKYLGIAGWTIQKQLADQVGDMNDAQKKDLVDKMSLAWKELRERIRFDRTMESHKWSGQLMQFLSNFSPAGAVLNYVTRSK